MIQTIDGCRLAFGGPFFREFTIETAHKNVDVLSAARRAGILAGIPLDRYFGDTYENRLLVAVTEKHSVSDFQQFCDVLRNI
jgi:glycine cleavage system pyridoxal-binding protein P